jgi:3-hydroxymyristoyl/3-hydroxydecanoyl-(acyl carrier protein) dehydratase
MRACDAPPRIDSSSLSNTFETDWIVDPELPFFKDHFPNKPLTPAYYQLSYIRRLFGEWLKTPPQGVTFKAIKFLAPIPPAIPVHVRVERKGTREVFGVVLTVGDQLATQGDVAIS